jgi:arginine repressor
MDAKTRIKTMIVDNPHISTDEIMVALERHGVQVTSLAVSSIRSPSDIAFVSCRT